MVRTWPGGPQGKPWDGLSAEQLRSILWSVLSGDVLAHPAARHRGGVWKKDLRGTTKADLWRLVNEGSDREIVAVALPLVVDEQVVFTPSIRRHEPKPAGEGTRPVDAPSADKRVMAAYMRGYIQDAVEELRHRNQYGYVRWVEKHCRVPGATAADHEVTGIFLRARSFPFLLQADLEDAFGTLPHGAFLEPLRRCFEAQAKSATGPAFLSDPNFDDIETFLDLLVRCVELNYVETGDPTHQVHRSEGVGIEQGNALSADLLVIAVAEILRGVDGEGVVVGACADDLWIQGRTEGEVRAVHERLRVTLTDLGFPAPRPLGHPKTTLTDLRRSRAVVRRRYEVCQRWIGVAPDVWSDLVDRRVLDLDELRRAGRRVGAKRGLVRAVRIATHCRAVTKGWLRSIGLLVPLPCIMQALHPLGFRTVALGSRSCSSDPDTSTWAPVRQHSLSVPPMWVRVPRGESHNMSTCMSSVHHYHAKDAHGGVHPSPEVEVEVETGVEAEATGGSIRQTERRGALASPSLPLVSPSAHVIEAIHRRNGGRAHRFGNDLKEQRVDLTGLPGTLALDASGGEFRAALGRLLLLFHSRRRVAVAFSPRERWVFDDELLGGADDPVYVGRGDQRVGTRIYRTLYLRSPERRRPSKPKVRPPNVSVAIEGLKRSRSDAKRWTYRTHHRGAQARTTTVQVECASKIAGSAEVITNAITRHACKSVALARRVIDDHLVVPRPTGRVDHPNNVALAQLQRALKGWRWSITRDGHWLVGQPRRCRRRSAHRKSHERSMPSTFVCGGPSQAR